LLVDKAKNKTPVSNRGFLLSGKSVAIIPWSKNSNRKKEMRGTRDKGLKPQFESAKQKGRQEKAGADQKKHALIGKEQRDEGRER